MIRVNAFQLLKPKTWGKSAHPFFLNVRKPLMQFYASFPSVYLLHFLIDLHKCPFLGSMTCQISLTINEIN